MTTYDAIVVGLGAMGSATAYSLAQRHQRVLGLDAFGRGHTLGASHGRSRIIREAYYEAPQYVPLVQRAYAQWRALEEEAGDDLLRITGGITIGPAGSDHIEGALASSRQHNLPHELLDAAAIRQRYPGFRPTDDLVGLVEPNAGILDPEAGVRVLQRLATAAGAHLHHEEPVRAWAADGAGVRVQTAQGAYQAQRLILAMGAWAGRLLPELSLPLVVHRVVNVHVAPRDPETFAPERCPVYLWAVPEGHYYGFPALPDQGVKFGRHDVDAPCTPETIRREVDDAEIDALRRVLDRYLPGASGPTKWALTCTYTLSPDQDFILDRHPEHPNVVFGCGFSGHGFKFTPVIGEALADLAMSQTPQPGIERFSMARFGPVAAASA